MKLLIKTIKDNWNYLLVWILVVLPWWLKSGYVFLVDFTWGPKMIPDIDSSWFIVQTLIKIDSLFVPVSVSGKAFLSLVILGVLVSGSRLAQRFTEDRFLVFIISLFALFNPFVYDRLMYGQIGIVAAYGLLLLVCSFLLRFLDGKNNQDILKAGLFSGLALMFSAHFVFFLVPVYLVFIIGLVAKRGEYKWKPLIGYLLLSLVLLLAINANWLASYVRGDSANSQYVAQGISQQDLKAFQTVGKNGLEAYKNVIMMSGFWGKEQRRYIDLSKVEEGWGRSFFILLPIIIYGVYLGLKRDNLRVLTLSLVSVYLVALVLAVGIASPTTGPISEWLFAHLPFYKGLREPQKWVSVLIMVYLIFLSIGIDALFKKKLLLDNKKVAGLFLVGVMIMQAPFMLWGLKGQVRPVEYPSDWAKADKFIKAQSFKTYGAECGKNILFLPWHLYMSFEWIGNVVANPAPVYFTCPVISGTNMETRNIYDNSPDQRGRAIGEWVLASGDGGEKILDEYEIGYIVLAKEVDWGKYTWLEKLPNWKLVVDSKTLRVYERR